MYKGIKKLAKLIKIMGEDIAKECNSCWKVEHVGIALGLAGTDEISVTDDSGYRAITIGDTRGKREGYMLLYSENCTYRNNSRVWEYRCFPSQIEIAKRLQLVLDKIPLIPLDKNNCESEEFWYENREWQTLTYLSEVVKKYADTIAMDPRTPEEIFASCQ